MNNPVWLAIFKDGTEIPQFKDDGSENRFKIIIDKFDELKYFILDYKEKCIQFVVDLEKGLITNSFEQLINVPQEDKNNLRLIHFRRHKVEIKENNIENSHTIVYYLGYQYNDGKDSNRKVILQIDSEGNFIIEG